MSTWMPRGQTALGLGVLTLGASVSTLFFYAPQKPSNDSASAPSNSQSDSVESGPDWSAFPSSDISEYQVVDVPHTNYPWIPERNGTAGQLSEPSGMDPREPLPKSYPGTVHRLGSYQSTGLEVDRTFESHTSSHTIPNDSLVPLHRKSDSSPAATAGPGIDPRRGISEGNRFGAGKHRPQVAPSYSRDVFPTATNLNAETSQVQTPVPNLLSPSHLQRETPPSSQPRRNVAPLLPMAEQPGSSNSNGMNPPDLLRSGPYSSKRRPAETSTSPGSTEHAPRFLSASQQSESRPLHPGTPTSEAASSPSGNLRLESTPQFVRQPKK